MKILYTKNIFHWIKIVFCFISIFIIGFLDNRAGYEYDLHLLYLLPIGYLSWKENSVLGIILAVLSAIVWSISMRLLPIAQLTFFHVWSVAIKISIFTLFSILISQIKLKQNKLIEMNIIKEKFLSVASHDLKTPFSSIIGYSQLLLQDKTLKDDQKEMVNIILNSSNLQLKYVNSIIELILSGSGMMKLDIEKKYIHEVIINAISNLKVLAENKNIEIQLNIPELKEVEMDALKIHQVITNLVANAIKFTHLGGVIKINCIENKKYIEIHVIDSGVGISQEDSSIIFTQNGLHPGKGTGGEKGTGLGLAICKNIVTLHHGSIGVKSELKKGSDFWFTLPLTAQ